MTRKCILCKETNYKNPFSFFSAPKDAETRKKWQEAIGIHNYIVNDETFVCSRHFTPGDIITHWVSGVPPHVVTIKYKKCRLRPGAIPNTSCENLNIMQNNDEDEFDNFELNRQWGSDRKPIQFSDDKKEVFLIPRADNIVTYTNIDVHNNSINNTKDTGNAEIAAYITETLGCESVEEEEEEEEDDEEEEEEEEDDDDDDDDDDENNHQQITIDSQEHHQDLEILQADMELEGNTIYLKTDDPSIIYVEDINLRSECDGETDMMQEVNVKEGIDECSSSKLHLAVENEDDDGDDGGGGDDDGGGGGGDVQGEELLEMWETIDAEKVSNQYPSDKTPRNCDDENMIVESLDPLEGADDNDDAMLFEDLLEVYTEVRLPRGWSSMVISAGRATTVIYARMSMAQTGVPYIQKQIYIKNDMTLHCSAAGNVINPRLHNLLREGRQLKVNTLSDVEQFVEEFDQRVVCEGTSDKINSTEIDTALAYRHDVKWRHIDCPIIINNGASRCSKCSTLNSQTSRRKMKKPPQTAESAELLKKERTIYVLQKLLAKMSKRNQKYETMKEIPKSFSSIVSSLDIPKIQKLMMKECAKSVIVPNSNEVATNFTETWIFLSLLIYIESPRMYRFLLLNKYMNLPGIKVMRRHLHQIKTDDQFYKLFQRTVEPFQHSEHHNKDETAPT